MLPITRSARTILPFPPTELRERVSGARDEMWFAQSGAQTMRDWQHALQSSGLRLADFPVVYDFGCGCGRVLRHLLLDKTPTQTILAADTDAEAIAWLTANIPGVTSMVLPERPPGPVAESSVDLILSHSVFTHLPEDVQFEWLADLRRVLRPGGYLLATIHGRKVVDEYLDAMGQVSSQDTVESVRAAMDTRGFYHLTGRTDAEASYPQYYGAALHSVGYVAHEWLRWFDLVAWHPTLALGHQDILVLRAKQLG